MPELQIQFEIGPDAELGGFARLVRDLATVGGASVTWADLETERAAENDLKRLAVYEPNQLIERLKIDDEALQQEMQDWLGRIRAAANWPIWWEEWFFESEEGSRRRKRLPPPPPYLDSGRLNPLWDRDAELPVAMSRLIAAESLERRGDGPSLRSLRYDNPFEVLVIATGATFVALAWLLTCIRNWPATRRINAAAAADAENTASARAKFRDQLLEKHARGELTAAPREVLDALGDAPIAAMERLAALDPRIEEVADTGES